MSNKFTLDTNCLIAVANNEPESDAIRALAEAHAANQVDVAVVAMSASERQRGGLYIQNFEEFKDYLESLGLGHLNVILPMAYLDISFWDQCLFTDGVMEALEREIHSILFPSVPFLWKDYCSANCLNPQPNPPTGKWRNCKCDVQAMWGHIHHRRNVFVTNDSNFHKASKKAGLITLGAGMVERPEGALSLLATS